MNANIRILVIILAVVLVGTAVYAVFVKNDSEIIGTEVPDVDVVSNTEDNLTEDVVEKDFEQKKIKEVVVPDNIEYKSNIFTGICGTVVYNYGASGFESGGLKTEIQIFDENRVLVKTKNSSEDGKYKIELVPGLYKIVLSDWGVHSQTSVKEDSCRDAGLMINAPSRE